MDNRISEEKLLMLWEDYFETRSPELKNELLMNYLDLVKRVVRRLMPQYRGYAELDDLINCGVMGLMDAVEKFRPDFGVKFETYATTRVRGEVLDYLRQQDWAPASLRKKISAIERCSAELENRLGREPTDEELAAASGYSVGDIQGVLQKSHMFNVVHFEDMLSETTMSIQTDEAGPLEVVENKDTTRVLGELIGELPEKERLVITLYYYEELTMKEISRVLKITESRVSQIHSRVLMKLRTRIADLSLV